MRPRRRAAAPACHPGLNCRRCLALSHQSCTSGGIRT
jgi:hypothetical protein